jgi:hypothetical protein
MLAQPLFASLALLQGALAATHIIWLPDLTAGAILANMPGPYRQLLLLSTAGVGLLLAGLAGLALRFATGGRWRESAAPAFALVGAAIWAGRAGLEVIFPLQVPLFGRTGLSPIILIDSLALVVLHLWAWVWSGDLGQPCEIPHSPLFDQHPMTVDYEDAYQIPVPAGTDLRAALTAFAAMPVWVMALIWVRDMVLARPLRLPRALPEIRRRTREGQLFPPLASGDGEELMGLAERHLDFQVLARIERSPKPRLVMHTRVHFNGWAGRLYFAPVRPVHAWLVPTFMGRARRVLERGPVDSRI